MPFAPNCLGGMVIKYQPNTQILSRLADAYIYFQKAPTLLQFLQKTVKPI